MLNNKKGAIGEVVFKAWPQLFALILLVIGFLVAISIDSVMLNYIVVILAGLLCGRFFFQGRRKGMFHYFLIIIGFIIGYLLGSYYTSRKVVVFLFIISVTVSYYIHAKKIIR